jgi:hypothetical protein
MPPPPNTTSGTALTVGALPYTNTQQVTDAGTCFTVWYQYTGTLGQLAIQVRAANATGTGTYVPDITFYESDGTTEILPPNTLTPIQVGTLNATLYFIKIAPAVVDLSSAMLRIDVSASPTAPIVASYVLINDDGQSGFNVQGHIPGVIINTSTGDVANMVFPLAQGDFGDILPDGEIALENFLVDDLVFYAPDFDVVATVDLSPATDFIRIRSQNTLDRFYVTVRQSGTTKFKAYSPVGVELVTMDTALAANPRSIAASNDGGTMYYALQASGAAIETWDLNTNMAGATFAAGVGSDIVTDILVMNNGDVLAMYALSGGTAAMRRYDSAGALQQVHTFGTSQFPNGAVPRLGYDANAGQTAFVAWWFPSTTVSRLQRIRISDGVALYTHDIPVYEEGVGQDDYAAGLFGASNSCPVIALGTNNALASGSNTDGTLFVDDIPTPTSTTFAIRRLRRAPHLSSEQLIQFFQMFQLDIQAGVGTTTGQGADPQLILRWSDDGGFTFGHEHWVSAGRIGQYSRRAIWRRLGRGRDRVFEVTMSDPVQWALLDAYLTAEKGMS